MTTDTQIVHLTGDYWGVEVKPDARKFYYWEESNKIQYFEGEHPIYNLIDLPSGTWSIVGLSNSITEEQARGIVEGSWYKEIDKLYKSFSYKNYNRKNAGSASGFKTALESFYSLLKSKNLNPDTTLILKRIE